MAIELTSEQRQDFAFITIEIEGGVAEPSELENLKEFLPPVDPMKGIVLSGRAPVWLFAYLSHQFHATAWVGTHDPRFGGAVIVQSHSLNIKEGQIIPV